MKIATTREAISEIITPLLPTLAERGWLLERITPSGRGIHLRSRALKVRIGLLSHIDPVAVAGHLDRLPDTTERSPMITIRDAIFERWEPVLRSLAQIPDQHPHRRPVTMEEIWQIASAALVRAEEAEAAIVEWDAAQAIPWIENKTLGGMSPPPEAIETENNLRALAARIREGREKGAQP